jgi:hypothetical protein
MKKYLISLIFVSSYAQSKCHLASTGTYGDLSSDLIGISEDSSHFSFCGYAALSPKTTHMTLPTKSHTLACYKEKSQSESIQYFPISGALSAVPIITSDFILVATENGFLEKVFPKKRNLSLWSGLSRQHQPPNRIKIPSPFVSHPIIHKEIFYGVTLNQNLYAIDIKSLEILWSYSLPKDPWGQPSPFIAVSQFNSTQDQEDVLLLGTSTGDLLAFKSDSGKIIWSQKTPFKTLEQSRIISISSDSKKVYVTYPQGLLALSISQGKIRWATPTKTSLSSYLSSDSLWTQNHKNQIIQISKESGRLLNSLDYPYPIQEIFENHSMILGSTPYGVSILNSSHFLPLLGSRYLFSESFDKSLQFNSKDLGTCLMSSGQLNCFQIYCGSSL